MSVRKPIQWDTTIDSGLEIASDLARLLIQMRNRPRGLDWIALGVASTSTAVKLYRKALALRAPTPWDFFVSDKWKAFPAALRHVAVNCAIHTSEAKCNSDTEHRVTLADLGGEEIGWVGQKGKRSAWSLAYYHRAREVETLRALGEALWQQVGTRHVRFTLSGIIDDDVPVEALYETDSLKLLGARVASFAQHDGGRGYLLHGPPGTGKTTAAQSVVAQMGLRSLRVEVKDLLVGAQVRGPDNSSSDDGSDFDALGIDTLVRVLRPEAILIDDIERLPRESSEMLLTTTERMHEAVKVFFATCNDRHRMPRSLLRVGRFDDHIQINGVEPAVLKRILDAEDHDLIDQMVGWPIAYVLDYRHRVRVLGRVTARTELGDLARRIAEAAAPDQASDSDDDNSEGSIAPVRAY